MLLNLPEVLISIQNNQVKELSFNSKKIGNYNDLTKHEFQMYFSSSGYHNYSIKALGSKYLAYCDNKNIALWDIAKTAHARTIKAGDSYSVDALVFLPNGNLASSSYNGPIKIWDIETGACLQTLPEHDLYQVRKLISLPNGYLASGASSIKIWDIETGICIRTLGENNVTALTLLPNGHLASASRDGIRIWDIQLGNCLKFIEDYYNDINQLTIVNSDLLASLGSDIKLWDITKGTCIRIFKQIARDRVNTSTVLHDGSLATAGSSMAISFWNVKSGSCVKTTLIKDSYGSLESGEIHSLLTLDDGRIVSFSKDSKLRIWSPEAKDLAFLDIIDIFKALKANRSVESLNLSGLSLDNNAAKLLASLLKVNQGLTTLDLSNNKITEQGARMLLAALDINVNLRSLNLEGNPISQSTLSLIRARLARRSNSAPQKPTTSTLNITNLLSQTTKDVEIVPDVDVPNEYLCPITQLIMQDPVLACDGETYEREAIEKWLTTKDTSPLHGDKLDSKQVMPNRNTKRMIDAFLDKFPHLRKSQDYYFSEKLQLDTIIAVREGNIVNLKTLANRDARLLIHPIYQQQNLLQVAVLEGNLETFVAVLSLLGENLAQQFSHAGRLAIVELATNRFGFEGYQAFISSLDKTVLAEAISAQGFEKFITHAAQVFGMQGLKAALTALGECTLLFTEQDGGESLFSFASQQFGIPGAQIAAKALQWEQSYYEHKILSMLPDIVQKQAEKIEALEREIQQLKHKQASNVNQFTPNTTYSFFPFDQPASSSNNSTKQESLLIDYNEIRKEKKSNSLTRKK